MDQRGTFRSSNRGLPPGTCLNGIYEIDEMIGAGGMGEVYRAHELQTGAPVAIKMLLPDMAENEAALALFRREASALHNLPHDAIVRYFLFTVEPTLQRPYLAMEFVNGKPLSEILDGGPLHFDRVVKLVRRVASGLQAAHERGIVHRDVSPDNIIMPLGDVKRAKIIDFGIARQVAIGDPTIIGSGFAGKENYVSPEQVGLFGGDVTPKSDIYSLGLVIYYAVTGSRLDMAGSQYQLVEKRRSVPDLAAVDPRFQPLLKQMLQPDPANRPASMADIADWVFSTKGQIDEAELGKPSVIPKVELELPTRTARGRVIAILALALAVIGGGLGLYHFVWPSIDLERPSTAQPGGATVAPPPAKSTTSRLAQIRTFIDRYDGGDCFFVFPVAVSQNATIVEGFGASNARFQAFADSFKREQGFEPSIGMRQITEAQCPAVKFLNQLHGDQSRAPRIILTSPNIKNGEALSGTLENLPSGPVELLLITDKGQVKNLSDILQPSLDSMSFSLTLQGADDAARPQLLLAVTSSRPIGSLKQSQAKPAAEFFGDALNEARRNDVAVASSLRYVKLGG